MIYNTICAIKTKILNKIEFDYYLFTIQFVLLKHRSIANQFMLYYDLQYNLCY